MINVIAIKKRNLELGITVEDWKQTLGLKSTPGVYNKINGKAPLSLEQAQKVQELLQIEDKDFGYYFFEGEQCDNS